MQGPCYYPGGHLWLYGLISRVFLVSDYCDLLFKVMHILIQSASQYLVIKISLNYFKNKETHRVQMIALMILLNHRMHELYQGYYNDAFLELFVVACIYFATSNRPVSAVMCLSIAITLKAGAILLIPALFGWIHYQHGTFKLLQSLFIFLLIQSLVAAPFISDNFCYVFGW